MSLSETKRIAFSGAGKGFMVANAFASKTVSLEAMRRLEVTEELRTERRAAAFYPHVKRVLDVALAGALVLLLSPLVLAAALGLLMQGGGPVLRRVKKAGRHCRPFNEYSFATDLRLVRKLPLLFNVLKGDLSFVGPRAACPGEMCGECRSLPGARGRSRVRPGLVCDWWVRRHASLGYVREVILDCQYADSLCFKKDMGILLRALPGLVTLFLWGEEPVEFAPRVSILDVRVDNLSMRDAIGRVMAMLGRRGPGQACFVNPHYINESFRVPRYKAVLDDADLVFADGFGTRLAGKILRRPICQNLCGTDLFPRLCSALSEGRRSIYLVGAAPGAAEQVTEWLGEHYPNIIVKGCHHGFFTPEEEPAVVRAIAASGADMLIASMGVPLQELWLHDHLGEFNVKVAMGFGGLFDYFAGRVPRAPQWVRDIGMEWVYRLLQEPRRMWRRYLIGNGLFLVRVLHERLRPQSWKGLPAEERAEDCAL